MTDPSKMFGALCGAGMPDRGGRFESIEISEDKKWATGVVEMRRLFVDAVKFVGDGVTIYADMEEENRTIAIRGVINSVFQREGRVFARVTMETPSTFVEYPA